MGRNRIRYGVFTTSVLLLGLLSRQFFNDMPFVRAYAGDVLWAGMVFFGIALVFSRQPTGVIALLTGLFCVGIECSQLYHAPWIDGLRATRVGGLVLGFSFGWSDLLCYGVGILVGAVMDRQLNDGR